MKQAISLMLILSLAIFSCGFFETNAYSESAFDNLECGEMCKAIFEAACRNVMINAKETTAFVQEFGDPYLKSARYYLNTDESLYYIAIDVTYGQSLPLNRHYDYYLKLIGNDDFERLEKPVREVKDSEWKWVIVYSEAECYKTALECFNAQRWKDPSSVTIYSYEADYGVGKITFYIDYSAKNSFGGNTRTTFIIEVDALNNKVIEFSNI